MFTKYIKEVNEYIILRQSHRQGGGSRGFTQTPLLAAKVHFKCSTIESGPVALMVLRIHHCPNESGQWLQLCKFVHGGNSYSTKQYETRM